ncbi:TIGR04063 family PEP-CTERM/XrtA system glycosyltransferase [Sphingomonas sp.]|uniref:TIGR04063 family PEP-CTERM/XrtA system glycosyltransferase n=1 Tax=Sphingomonas sp. TaxID=28214 RepID=UPI002C35DE6D|nr:TIGR04063 family PEP-CTERM/XrtA system glycosyltransferase [Sphingomonas sp.]HTG37491.1 TIGR04063 family PEP-CTERM/XrtA system glycosyltransferase [Sphingomonas sp.]
MRILHILDHSLPLHSGYTFRTRAIMKAQTARGWAVAGVTGPRYNLVDAPVETFDGLTFHRSSSAWSAPMPVGLWHEIATFARAVDRAVAAFRPDILHAHSPVLGALAGLRVARRHSIPILYEIRAFWEDAAVGNGTGREGSARYRLIRALETYACRRVDAVAVICEGLRGDLIARGIDAERITVSPNGVDLSLFGEPLPRDDALAAGLGLGTEVIGYVGSFYDYEGLDDLIAAMPALVARRPGAQLLMVGGGPMEAMLRAAAAASPVADHIRFVGRVPHDQVERYYSLIDVLAYPRKHMRLTDLVTPLKPLEAMAQRRLVAASDVGGHRELIEDGVTGTLFAPDDPAAIADALGALLSDRGDWEARRDRARLFVERERNWSSNISRYKPVYQRLTKAAEMDESWSRIPGVNA